MKNYKIQRLKLTTTNHFILEVGINDVPGIFILDTGASNTCVGIDRAAFFGLHALASDIKAAGAGTTEMETSIAKNNTITIGAWTKTRQKIVLFDLVHVNQALVAHQSQPVDGFIGADILKKAKAII
ncbi:MAG: retropepsin-like aspartic protease, partial [Bacteroidota bacterium]